MMTLRVIVAASNEQDPLNDGGQPACRDVAAESASASQDIKHTSDTTVALPSGWPWNAPSRLAAVWLLWRK